MVRKVENGEAKFKVRATALALGRFTVADIERATGLNSSSIQSELQRMKGENLLIRSAAPRGVGVPATYEVSADPESLRSLTASVEAFRPAKPASESLEDPTSPEYKRVVGVLELATVATPERRDKLLRVAESLLDETEEAEVVALAPDRVRYLLRLQRARIAFLRHDYSRAWSEFDKLEPLFASIGDDDTSQLIDEYRRITVELDWAAAEVDQRLPLLTMKRLVIFPHNIVSLVIGKPNSVLAVEEALLADQRLVYAMHRGGRVEDASADMTHRVGTLVEIVAYEKNENGQIQLVLEGIKRVRLSHVDVSGQTAIAAVQRLVEMTPEPVAADAMLYITKDLAIRYHRERGGLSGKVLDIVLAAADPGQLADFLATQLLGELEDERKERERQALLEQVDPLQRLQTLANRIRNEIGPAAVDMALMGRKRKLGVSTDERLGWRILEGSKLYEVELA